MQLYEDHRYSGASKSAKKSATLKQIAPDAAGVDPKTCSDKKKPDTMPLEVSYVPAMKMTKQSTHDAVKS